MNQIAPDASHILIANDHEWVARSLESVLAAEGYRVERAYTGQQVLEQAARGNPDLLILDFQLPDLSGPEVARRLRAEESLGPATPIIVTTAAENSRTRMVEALEAGAWDFVTQPFDGPSLVSRVRTYLAARAAYRALARGQGIQSVHSRPGFGVRLEEAVASAHRRQEPLTCLAIAPVHDAGGPLDELTDRRLAHTLRANTRGGDAVGRLAPWRYGVILDGLERGKVTPVAARLRRAAQQNGQLPALIMGACSTGLGDTQSSAERLLETAVDALGDATAEVPVVVV